MTNRMRRFVAELPEAKRNGGTLGKRYAKVGGNTTDDLQEAEVVGWTKKSHERWERYGYRLVPVEIVTLDQT